MLAAGLVLIAAAALFGSARWVRRSVHESTAHSAADRVIMIEPGMGAGAIARRLADAGIVNDPTALTIYLYATGGGGNLKAGDYKFASPTTPLQAIEKIRRGDVSLEKFTAPEGFNRFDIADSLASKTGKGSRADFLRLMKDGALIAQWAPSARNLEGYLFPDTYNYTGRTTAEELIKAMVKRFDEVFTPEWAAKAAARGMTIQQIVTLASIIEKEAAAPEDRPLIASALYNRLKRGMPLAADPTFIYAALLEDDYDGNPNNPRHRRRDSFYNTYKYPGLPPGPIASPGRASLEAALNPAETDYLYYVLSTGGKHKFSRTAAEHERAVAEYRRLKNSGALGNGGR